MSRIVGFGQARIADDRAFVGAARIGGTSIGRRPHIRIYLALADQFWIYQDGVDVPKISIAEPCGSGTRARRMAPFETANLRPAR
jgi:hypothetical protein